VLATEGDARYVATTRYINAITPVEGENYRTLHFKAGEPVEVRPRSGKIVRYAP